MTDFASQGKTRAYNVVDISASCDHQSVYTALSRGTSAAGTLIAQNFPAQLITGGVTGALRQEFRSLDILDEITDLRYNGKLPESVQGTHCKDLIKSFRLWKGETYVPRNTHPCIRWSKGNQPWEDDPSPIEPWTMVAHKKTSSNENVETDNLVPAQGTASLILKSESTKRKLDTEDPHTDVVAKRLRIQSPHPTAYDTSPPLGLIEAVA
ncbi:hypothetical protein BKA70DRAFT_1104850 [Coprinopsis sp. MPI-PUGE-AT-0042]|nr:hypothetical protein BKA70DRAFT_1104850 [Coprinopsis sp. MPI-PUGE-AT-0042]